MSIIGKNTYTQFNLSSSQKDTLIEIINMYEKNDKVIKSSFFEKINTYENIRKIIEWWDANVLKFSIDITSIGKVLAHTNAKRIDDTLPDLN